MLLGELIEGTGARLSRPQDAAVRICDLTEDSRTVLPGSLFIARSGQRHDGRRFIPGAIEAGAVAVLTDVDAVRPSDSADTAWITCHDLALVVAHIAERFFANPAQSLDLVGVTGTNGKTTVAHLVHQILNAASLRCGLIGTVCIDDGNETADASLTTPFAIEISHALRNMADAGCRAAVIETSSHALAQGRVAALEFNAAVFTNLTGEHLDFHRTMEEYALAKARLFAQLRPDGVAIVNALDPAAPIMLDAASGRAALRCAPEGWPNADCTVHIASRDLDRGMALRLHGPWGAISATVPLLGDHNAMNCLQAVATVHALGVETPVIEEALSSVAPPPGRLERVIPRSGAQPPFDVIVDYAHSDDALANVLRTLRPHAQARGTALRIAFGCGGDRDRSKRPRSGRVAAELADAVVVTVNDAHTEQPSQIVRDILEGIPDEQREKIEIRTDRAQAIELAIQQAQPGDIVLIAGKGHEKIQYLPDGRGGEKTIPFEDRAVARAALERRMSVTRSSSPIPTETHGS